MEVFPQGSVETELRVAVASREGSEITLPVRARLRPSPQDLLTLYRDGGERGARGALATALETEIRRAGASIGTYDLASGSTRPTLQAGLTRMLEERFGPGSANVTLGAPEVPAAVRASFEKEAIYGRRRDTGLKVLLLGIDGADWDVINPMIARGELPVLAGLKKSGVFASLRSSIPTLSPLLWTTIATGKSPDRHGINDFLVADPRTGRRVPINASFRTAKALWTILTEAGLRSDVVAWWATWPAEAIRGHLVSDRVAYSTFRVAGPTGSRGLVHPADYLDVVARLSVAEEAVTPERVGRFLHVVPAELAEARAAARSGAPTEAQESMNLFVRVLAATETYRRIALDLLSRREGPGGPQRLAAFYFQGVDEVGHRFAHCAPPRIPLCADQDRRRFGDAVTAFYRYQDGIIGELLRAAGPGWTVLVVSDHGFASGSGRPRDEKPFIEGRPGLWHDLHGVFMAAGPAIGRGEIPTVTLYDIAPTILHLLGLPAADDMPGKVLEGALTDVFRSAHPLERIPSYEGLGAPEEGLQVEIPEDESAEALVAQLRQLGYVGGEGDTTGGTGEVPGPAGSPAGRVHVPAGERAPGGGGPPVAGAVPTLLYHTNLGAVHLGRRQFDLAEAEFRKALQIDPTSTQALSGMALLHETRGEPEKALEALLRLLRNAEADEHATLVKIAELYARMGRAADGVAFMRAHRPRSETGGRGGLGREIALGLLHAAAGSPQQAETSLLQALRLEPTSILAMQELFGLYDQQGRSAALEPRLREALRVEPRSAMHHNWLGLVLRRRGDLEGAEEEFRRTLEVSPDLTGAMANLGSLYLQQQRTAEAVDVLRKAIEKDPRNVESRTNLIVALGMSRDLEGARRIVEEAESAGQRVPLFYNAMAYALHVNGRDAEALSEIRRSLQLDPRQPDALRLQAEIEGGSPARGLPYP
jgi:predicted AlkP superfamily phosphohydrolase/phosphomutase/tetratricopeptide (TPR) repeat protein